ncbi:MAG: GtrA family protein [Clostridia bacterium]|nr:GtrA family protein [Clostridia bacterium]
MIKQIYEKYREIILYIVFGVLTTAVGWGVYFAVMAAGRAIFALEAGDASSPAYIAVYTAAMIIQWVCAVLTAFFTNRKYVFTDADRDAGVLRQLAVFSSGRLLTLGLDYVVTLAGTYAMTTLFPSLLSLTVFGVTFNADEAAAKILASVLVLAANYVISKFLVFRSGRERDIR